MARFHGEVGYGIPKEDPPGSGNWIREIKELTYTGDVIRNARNLDVGDKVNSDISLANSISVVADPYAVEHFAFITYVRWMGVVWTVTTVESRPPRLILNVGGVYHGRTLGSP